MKRRYPPFLTEDVLSAPEPGVSIRILVSRQSTSDRTLTRRSGSPTKRGGAPRVVTTHGQGFGAFSAWVGLALALAVCSGWSRAAAAQSRATDSVLRPATPPSSKVIGAAESSLPAPRRQGVVLELHETVEVDGEGIFLDQIVTASPASPLPHVRLAPAPTVGQATVLIRTQVMAWIQTHASALVTPHWSGTDRCKVTRRTRNLDENELRGMLQSTLQRDHVKERGEVELRLTRPWSSIAVADEPITLKVVDLPATGVGSNFIVRFELWAGQERLGAWQAAASAKVWREILVAESPLKRGQLLRDAPIIRERRDVLALRDPAIVELVEDGTPGEMEFKENVGAGQPILARSMRVRPAVFRGSIVDALIFEGGMKIHLKVEVLEDGLPGHVVRVRNPRTRREMLGKVHNERTILIPM